MKLIHRPFEILATWISNNLGHPLSFLLACSLIFGWALCGPYFGWSDSHSLFINTITTIVTFLMVFLLQNSQNRQTQELKDQNEELLEIIRKLVDKNK